MANADLPSPDPREQIAPTSLPISASVEISTEESAVPEVRRFRRRGWSWLAWLIVVLVIGGGTAAGRFGSSVEKNATSAKDSAFNVDDFLLRYWIGANDLLKSMGQDPYLQAAKQFTGSPEKSLRRVVMAGEMKGPTEALAVLKQLNGEDTQRWTPRQRAVADTLRQLYQDYERKRFDAPALSEQDRERLRTELGWAGDLALHPRDSTDTTGRTALIAEAHRSFAAVVGIGTGILVLFLLGLFGLGLLLILGWHGLVHSSIGPASGTGGLYAETFALWMVLYPALGITFSLLTLPGPRLLWVGALSLLSLSVLAWPVLWGVPWRQVREEIGLVGGRLRVLEPIVGIGAYIMAVPLYVGGLAGAVIILVLQGLLRGTPMGEPPLRPHPIMETVVRADWWELLQVLILASVTAPIVEETMFRGVLYRHLREASSKFRITVSILVSGTVVGFVFAVVHPYGIVAVPVLMGLSFGFIVAREWRGSLVPCMVAHGIHNALVLILVRTILGGT